MSDRALRELERAASLGDQDATESLIYAYRRAGDQAGLCSLGEHELEDPSVLIWIDALGEFQRCARSVCRSCFAIVTVPWVERRGPTFESSPRTVGEMYAQIQHQVRMWEMMGEGVAYLRADGTVQILSPVYVDEDRTNPIGIALEALSAGEHVDVIIPRPTRGRTALLAIKDDLEALDAMTQRNLSASHLYVGLASTTRNLADLTIPDQLPTETPKERAYQDNRRKSQQAFRRAGRDR